MRADTILQVVTGVRIVINGQQSTVVQTPDGPPVECGRHGLTVLEAFRSPQTVQTAVDLLASRSPSRAALVEIMSTLVKLRDAGLLAPPAGVLVAGAADFSAPPIHIAMLNDRVRTDAYVRAIRETVRPGDVVLDLGTGIGVFAVAAAQAGARQVYALEAGAMAGAAAAVFAANGVADRITLLRRWSTDVVLGEPVDVLVTETLGGDPWEEGFLHLVADASKRFLRPHARIIPSRVQWLAQPLAVPVERQHAARFLPATVAKWTDWYGIEFGPLAGLSDPDACVTMQAPRDASDWHRPSPPALLADVDVGRAVALARTASARTVVTGDGIVDGVLLYWEADLAPGVRLLTAPAGGAPTSWRLPLVLARESLAVRRGDTLNVKVQRGALHRFELTVDRA